MVLIVTYEYSFLNIKNQGELPFIACIITDHRLQMQLYEVTQWCPDLRAISEGEGWKM